MNYSLRERRRPDPSALLAMIPAWMRPDPKYADHNVIVRAVKRNAAGEVTDLRYLTTRDRWTEDARVAVVFSQAAGALAFLRVVTPFGFVRDVQSTIAKAHIE